MDALLDSDTVSLLDFDSELPCEGAHHLRGLSGHAPEEAGAFMVISPCCGPKVVQCSARVSAMRSTGVLYCGACEYEHLTSDYSFIPFAA
ncbi:hypothetical protein [Cryobacterium tagatosivorans]|uniref:Uncharacterized protein n=1 Tax=Cryobacterium tagatosivorans TaxID=1259199 RepID=A0A4R8UF59_9MICO|nr:hypothetical protein [Cryobacterium tagatosivorans]TFB51217.1 hypothetical protein E3O23_08620 [Cryobacterium tagatosivorans]